MKKQLFIENSPFLSRLVIEDNLKESIQIKQGKNNTLVVKNIPATVLNRTNQNGRIYGTSEMQKAIDAARQQIATKQLLCQADEHPEGSFVAPTHASHVITGAYIKKNVKLEVEGEKGTWDVLFCDIEVLNTQEGKNLQALLLSGCSIGTSIRGLGDMEGDQVVNYEFLGFDIVSNPSSGTFTNMPIYEARMESTDENVLNEATKFTVSTYASNTTHDLEQAMQFQNKASQSLQYGTITNMNTKMDQEVDPKTGVEKTVGEVEVETSDDTSDLKTALEIAGRAFTNPENINVTSITIEKIDEDDMKDSVMQGGASDTLTEEEFMSEDSAGAQLYKRWKKEIGDKSQVVNTAIGPFAIFPTYDGTGIAYGRCDYNGVVSRDSGVEGQIPYNPAEDLPTQVQAAADKVNEEYGYESDLLDSAEEDQEPITEGGEEWVVAFIDENNNEFYCAAESNLVDNIDDALKFASQEEADAYKQNIQKPYESVDPASGIATYYVDAIVKRVDEDKVATDESILKEAPLWSTWANIKDWGSSAVNNIKKNFQQAMDDEKKAAEDRKKAQAASITPDKVWDATLKGKKNFLKACLDHGVKLNVKKNGITPLMYAATRKMPEIVDILAKDPKSLNAVNMDGNTALMLATAYANDPEAVEILLRNGADLDIQNKNGKTVYDYAQKKPEILNIIQQYKEQPGAAQPEAEPEQQAAQQQTSTDNAQSTAPDNNQSASANQSGEGNAKYYDNAKKAATSRLLLIQDLIRSGLIDVTAENPIDGYTILDRAYLNNDNTLANAIKDLGGVFSDKLKSEVEKGQKGKKAKESADIDEAAPEGEIEQNDNKLTINVDGEEIEKDFKTDTEARVAKAGLENGELTANVMYDEASSWWALKVTAGEYQDWYVTEDEQQQLDVSPDDNVAMIFPTEEEAKQYQVEHDCEEYDYGQGLTATIVPVQLGITDDEIFGKQEANIDEKLYSSEDPASDSFEQQPVTEEIKDIKVTLGDIVYDIDENSDFEGDPEEIAELIENRLPDTIEVELNGIDVPEENAEEYIYQKACEQTGLPIKNATIIDIEEIEKEDVKEEDEGGEDMGGDMGSDDSGGLDGGDMGGDEGGDIGGDDMGGDIGGDDMSAE